MKSAILAVAMVATAVSFSAEAAPKKGAAKAKVQLSGTVNLNQASEKQLDLLPGVGPKVAHRIVEARKAGAFTTTAQVMKVKGFGKKRFEKLKGYLTVNGPTTLAASRVSASPDAQGRSAPPSR
jgi:competence protein ComEA